MPEGPLGGPRPFVDSDGEGPLGFERPLAKTVDDCMDSVEAQKFVDNYEESMGTTLSADQKEDLKRAWCKGVVETDWKANWYEGLREAGVRGI